MATKYIVNNVPGQTITGDITINGNLNITGTTSSAFTGGTVSGATEFTEGLTANTISATTYQNLPTDVRVTGATYSNNTFTYTNNTGGTFDVLFNTVTGLTVNGNLTVTGTTNIRPYKVYTALLTQTGTNPPIAVTVLENTLGGNITFTYFDVGNYRAISDSLFTPNKTSSILAGLGSFSSGSRPQSSTTVSLSTAVGGVYSDNGLINTLFEIKVYD